MRSPDEESAPFWRVTPGGRSAGKRQTGARPLNLPTVMKPDLILLDIGMPNLNGLEAARQILAFRPRPRF